jgi:signal transduction histidine kinase
LRAKLAIVFTLIVLVPLGLLAGLGFRVVRSEQELVRHQFEKLQRDRLREVESLMRKTLDEIERDLLKSTAITALEPDTLRAAVRRQPLFRQTFAIAENGVLVHPSPRAELSEEEREFLRRTRAIWARQAVLYETPSSETSTITRASGARGTGDSILDLARRANHGWIAWYWEEGVHFLFWRRHASGGVVGGEVERIALLSRLVGELPSVETERGRVLLLDSRGVAVHTWGALSPSEATGAPFAVLELGPPLDSLRLEYFASSEDVRAFSGDNSRFNVLAGLGLVAVILLALAFYFYGEYTRDLREAARRVSFVTQVSHELKTPLTNIRLYAELLMDRLADDEHSPEGAIEQLSVITSESQRLTRLINNILTFSKQRRGALTLERAPTDVDEVIAGVLGQFGPSLQSKGLTPKFERGAVRPVLVDKDAFGQIIANLISNVEKYAAGGGVVTIESAQNAEQTTVTVSDRGPGIPAEHRSRIFDPFYRVSDRLSDGVAGTGIGLTIARDLARLHGGDLVLAESEIGARFQLIL